MKKLLNNRVANAIILVVNLVAALITIFSFFQNMLSSVLAAIFLTIFGIGILFAIAYFVALITESNLDKGLILTDEFHHVIDVYKEVSLDLRDRFEDEESSASFEQFRENEFRDLIIKYKELLTKRYTIELLRAWKQIAEEYAMTEVATNTVGNTVDDDVSLIKFYVQCFDRPAFQDEISQEGRMEDFDKAIEDTIIALNTGILRTRDGVIIKQSEGKSTINNPMWRQKLDNIGDMLASIRRRLKIAEEESAFTKTNSSDNEVFYCFRDRELEEWFNITREEILKVLSSVCREARIRELHFMRRKYYRGW